MTRAGTLLFAGDTVPNKPFTFGGLLKQLCAEHDIKVFNLEAALLLHYLRYRNLIQTELMRQTREIKTAQMTGAGNGK